MMARHIGTEAKLFSFAVLSHQNLDRISRTGGLGRDQIALEGPAVERDALHPVLHACGIVHADLVFRTTEGARHSVVFTAGGDAGRDLQPVEGRLHAQNGLGDRQEGPGRRAGEPGILGLAKAGRVLAGHHLAVDVGLLGASLPATIWL